MAWVELGRARRRARASFGSVVNGCATELEAFGNGREIDELGDPDRDKRTQKRARRQRLATMTGISWTDETWNPWVGCALVSPGCTNCYAMWDAWRLANHPTAAPWYKGTVKLVKGRSVWTGEVNRAWDHKFEEPLSWRSPCLVFVNSMSDFMLGKPSWRRDAFAIMTRCPQHQFQILTKRAERLHLLPAKLPPNVWIGVSIERQDFIGRLDHLRQVNASVRWISAEPLLGPLELDLSGIHWVVAGGESGPRRRPVKLAWLRSIRDQCAAAGIPYHTKQVDKVKPIPERSHDPRMA